MLGRRPILNRGKVSVGFRSVRSVWLEVIGGSAGPWSSLLGAKGDPERRRCCDVLIVSHIHRVLC